MRTGAFNFKQPTFADQKFKKILWAEEIKKQQKESASRDHLAKAVLQKKLLPQRKLQQKRKKIKSDWE